MPTRTDPKPEPRNWEDLSPAEQTALRVDFGRWLDGLPPTCSLQTKIERFRTWLLEVKGVHYRG